jgi:hypothetical protein
MAGKAPLGTRLGTSEPYLKPGTRQSYQAKTLHGDKIMDLRTITSTEKKAILGEEPKRLQWSYFFPVAAQAGVGARMILDRYSLGYVNGRVSWMGNDQNLDKKAADTCVTIGLADKLHKFIVKNGITSTSSDIIFGEMDGYRMLATPNGSYGYVYLSFWAV